MLSIAFARLRKYEKPSGNTSQFSWLFYIVKGMKFCTQVPRTCVQKRVVLDFHLFVLKIRSQMHEFQTVHKI